MSYKKTLFIGLLLTVMSVSPGHATIDPGMVSLRGAITAQQLLEYLQMLLSLRQDLDRMQTMGETSDVKNETGTVGQSVKPEEAKPIVLSELKSSASKGMEGRKEIYEKTDSLLTADLSTPEGFQKAKDASNAIVHITATDSYGKALQMKASATNEGIDAIDEKAAQGTENFQEKASGFMLYIPPIARKLNSINRLDAQLNTMDAAQKMPTILGESMPTDQLSTKGTSSQGSES